MKDSGSVTVERDGRTFAASYTVENGIVHVKTHTETRSIELGDRTPEAIATEALNEILDADRRP